VDEEEVGNPESRSTASSLRQAIGSPARLPDVITSGTPASASSRWCSGEYGRKSPTSGLPGATSSQSGVSGRREQHDGPLDGLEQLALGRADVRGVARRRQVAHHHGERLLVAALALAKPADRPVDVASQARWKPPIPFSATIRPSRSAGGAAAIGSRRR
jgi:hypothetical protein